MGTEMTAAGMPRAAGSRSGAGAAAPVAACMGRPARRALMDGHGSVLAAIASALYLESAAGVACLVPPSAPRGPLNVVLPGFKPGGPELHGASWRTDGATLAIGGFGTFAIRPHDEWMPPCRPSADPAAILAGLASMQAALAARAPRGEVLVHALGSLREHPPFRNQPPIREAGTCSPPCSIDAHFARAVPALSRWLDDELAGRNASSPEPVAALLGAGRGLTPSGDDCVVGVLAALHAFGEHGVAASVAHTVSRYAPRRTSRLSAAHLHAACAGEAVEPVHAAIEAIAGNAFPAPALDALERFGQGSGFDAMAGILVATRAIAHNRASSPPVRRQRRGGTGRTPTPVHRQ